MAAGGCSPYKGIQNSAYKASVGYLRELKKNGVSQTAIDGENYFEDWNEEAQSLPTNLKKDYQNAAIRSWSVSSIDESDNGLIVHVDLDTSDLSFLDTSSLYPAYMPELSEAVRQAYEADPALDPAALKEQLTKDLYAKIREQIKQAESEEVQLDFQCDKADGHILSITQASNAS